MDKPKNRIKEVLEEKGIKQTWLAEKLGKSFCIVNSYVCQQTSAKFGCVIRNCKHPTS